MAKLVAAVTARIRFLMFSLLSVDGTQITHVTGVPSVFQHGWSARQAGRDQPPQGGRTLQDHTIPFLKGNRTIPFLFWRATANKVEEFPGRIVPRRRVSVRSRFARRLEDVNPPEAKLRPQRFGRRHERAAVKQACKDLGRWLRSPALRA
jgi:hypothetical protein